MATISSTGIGSGLDIDSLVSKLVAAERSAGQTRIDTKKGKLTEQFLGDGATDGRHVGLPEQPELAGQRRQFHFPQSVRERREGIHRPRLARRQPAGSYDVQVEQLAKAAQLGSDAFGSASTPVGTGTLTISVGESSFQHRGG
jgi:flagellar hook-associated protein 2